MLLFLYLGRLEEIGNHSVHVFEDVGKHDKKGDL